MRQRFEIKSRTFLLFAAEMLAVATAVLLPAVSHADLLELTSRPATGNIVYWGQLGTPNLTLTSPQSFTSTEGTTGSVSFNGNGLLVTQCCVGISGIFDGDFAPGTTVLATSGRPNIGVGSPLTINFNSPVQSVGTQIQDEGIGDHFTAEILAFSGSTFLGVFTENGFSGDVGDNSNIFLGVQDTTADITSVTYLTFTGNPFTLQDVAINQMTLNAVPGPTVGSGLSGFIFALGAFILLAWRKKRWAAVGPIAT